MQVEIALLKLAFMIGMPLIGLGTICTGKLPAAKNRILDGIAAQLAGIVLLLPPLLSLASSAAVTAITGEQHESILDSGWLKSTGTIFDWGSIALCQIVVVLIGHSSAENPSESSTDRKTATWSIKARLLIVAIAL